MRGAWCKNRRRAERVRQRGRRAQLGPPSAGRPPAGEVLPSRATTQQGEGGAGKRDKGVGRAWVAPPLAGVAAAEIA